MEILMTIGIGVVCSDKTPGDCFILASDRLGSFGDDFSTRRHCKMFIQPEQGLYAVSADNVGNASELLAGIYQQWAPYPPQSRGYNLIRLGMQRAVYEYKMYQFVTSVLPRYPIDPKENWKTQAESLGLSEKLFEEFRQTQTGCELIVGTIGLYDNKERYMCHLLYADESGEVTPFPSSGFGAIGSGAANALFWLSYREQNLGMSVKRSALHVYEAKLMAEHSPHVGRDDIELLIVTPGQWYQLTHKRRTVNGCPVSLDELEELHRKFGPSSTESLGSLSGE
jgi:hypothetical protein